MRAAWVVSVFPRLTETFVLNEIMAVQHLGNDVDIYPLRRSRERVVHPEAERLAERTRVIPFVSLKVFVSQLYWLGRDPARYLGALGAVLRGTWGSANFFFGALAIFPKVAHAARAMAADGVQHVHCHFANHPALAGFVINRLTGIPFSFTGHGHDLHVDRRMLCDKLAAASFAVMISEYNRRLVIQDCGAASAAKLELVHCGVDTQLYIPGSRANRGKTLTIACIASLLEVKGHQYLIDACRVLRERDVDFVCHLVGEGRLRSQIAERIETAGLVGRVILRGAAPRAEVISVLQEADVIVLTSIQTARGSREGIPVSLMEGMACGLPVVASEISGIPELVEQGRTGFLTPPGDSAAIADALERLATSQDLRARMGQAGREVIVRDFDANTNAAKLIRIIKARSARAN